MPVTLSLKTRSRTEMVDITAQVQGAVAEPSMREGICVVYVPHTTAAVTINEGADPSVCFDIMERLKELVPEGAGYRHAEGNSDSHIKAALVGSSVTVIVEDGHLVLGTWQKVFFCEFDGPRTRTIMLKMVASR
jgi:secondary thiamine-phosphate synthase enzyme